MWLPRAAPITKSGHANSARFARDNSCTILRRCRCNDDGGNSELNDDGTGTRHAGNSSEALTTALLLPTLVRTAWIDPFSRTERSSVGKDGLGFDISE
jgi:hypothetical protein